MPSCKDILHTRSISLSNFTLVNFLGLAAASNSISDLISAFFLQEKVRKSRIMIVALFNIAQNSKQKIKCLILSIEVNECLSKKRKVLLSLAVF